MTKSVNTIQKLSLGQYGKKTVQYGYFPYWPDSSQSNNS